ncbi:MAG: hypothetical protein ACLVEV_01880 [Lachnospiraceae bacterium]|uniref:hypothetical protein n=1 Tax=Parablautia sp. Marseille-Q6255 TaxID=3039593 RepID=UPI0024BBFB93|nr:hypothetical protein [Parablautia sp. Marseille-Q6255]
MEDGTWRDSVKKELKKLSKMTWKERIGYVWDYYKAQMALLIGLILLIHIGVTIFQNMQIEEVLQAYLVNCNAMEVDAKEMSAEFADYVGGLDKHQVATVNTTLIEEGKDAPQSQSSMAEQMKLTTLIGAQAIDVVVLDELAYETYLEDGFLMDLSGLLTPEQKEQWQERLEEDAGGACYAVEVTDSPVLASQNAYFGGKIYAAVMANSVNTDMSIAFVDYLLCSQEK